MKTPDNKKQRSRRGYFLTKSALFLSVVAASFFAGACKLNDPKITEEHSKTFLKLYGEEKTRADGFILKSNGGFYIIGTHTLDKDADKIVFVETDPYGNPVPIKDVETGFDASSGKSLLHDADGNLLFLGQFKAQQAFLAKKTADMGRIWTDLQRSAPKYNEIAVAVAESPDGSGYLVLADTDESPDIDGASNLLLYKTDKNGNQLWRRVLGFDKAFATKGIKDNGFGLFQSSVTNEISIFLNVETNGETNMALIVTNALGDITSAYRYDSYEDIKKTVKISARGNKVSKTNDGFIICGTQRSGKAIVVKKIGNDRKELWERVIDVNVNTIPSQDQVKADFGIAAVQTADGGVAVCGTAFYDDGKTNFYNQIFFTKLNSMGEFKGLGPGNYFGGPGQDRATDLVQTTDGGFAVLGTVSIEGNEMMSIIKLDPDGNLGLK